MWWIKNWLKKQMVGVGSWFPERTELRHIPHIKNVPFDIFMNGCHLNDKQRKSENDTELSGIM